MDEKKRSELERVLEEKLEQGDANGDGADPSEQARQRITAPYEYRVRAEVDPIAEETRLIRKIAKEPDGKYDKYDKQ